MNTALSEHDQQRRQALTALMQLGIDPYPAAAFDTNANAADILANYERDKTN